MGARDSDDDIRKYIADVDTIMKGADPVRAKQQLDQARDNPELDEAIEELSDGLKEGESPFEFPIVYIRPKAKRAAPEAPTKAPSPWASDAPQIERGALPSSFAPNAAPPVTTPIPPEGTKGTKGARGSKRRFLPSWRVSALAVLAALSPVMLVLLFLRLHGSPGTSPVAPSASGQASAVPAAPSTSATASSTPTASAPRPAPMPQEVDAGSADAYTAGAPMSAPTAQPIPSSKPRKQGGTTDQPHDAVTSTPVPSAPPPTPSANQQFIE